MLNSIKNKFTFFERNETPLTIQNEVSECGLACISMILGHYKNNLTLQELRNSFTTSLKGMTLKDIMDVLESFKFKTRAVSLEIDEVSELKTPCILHWDMSHFVVLTKTTKNTFWINDPAIGKKKISKSFLSKHFTGVALEIYKTNDIKPKKIKKQQSLMSVTGNIKGFVSPLLSICSMSVLLEVFALSSPLYMQWILDRVIISEDEDLLTILLLIFFSVSIFNPLLETIRTWFITRLSAIINVQWSYNITNHLFKLPLSWFEKRSVGDVLSRSESIKSIQEILTGNLFTSILDGIMSIVTLVVITLYSIKLSLITITLSILYAITRFFYFNILKYKKEESLVSDANLHSEILESIRGILTIKVSGIENLRLSRYINKFIDSSNKHISVSKLDIIFSFVNHLIFGLSKIVIIWYATKLVLNGEFTSGILIAFLSYNDMFTNRIVSFIDNLIVLKMLNLYTERLSDITLSPPEKNRIPNNGNVTIHGNGLQINSIFFKYAENDIYILKNLSISIKDGESVAIVGASGRGKTTLAKIILGLLDVNEGDIFFGKRNIKEIGMKRYRSMIGCVMQEDSLLSGTIVDNISMFDENHDLDRVIHVAKLANIHAEIMNMPMDYHSLVGDMGSALSGGQIQRILLARALYRNPKLLVLDEATSNLDVENERIINKNLKSLNITRIVIAHRPETISSAERVIEI
ncbi:peptidase domain-containing ABC transporter [Salmonella enterica subsp. enterica]|nr:peptidase domain-containing ABC transporter [Salmonella enterica subsp. enterica serovar Hvittingfoss]EEN5590932.1 peptidase domain-containing ABC transporter [Salmonella enterica subsp. enterica serovar Mountpleasant]